MDSDWHVDVVSRCLPRHVMYFAFVLPIGDLYKAPYTM